MNFFEHQEASRRRTRRLLLAFAVSVLAVVIAVTWVLVSLVSIMSDQQMLASGGWLSEHLGVTLITALFVFGIIGAASLVRMSQLSGGGGAVARAVGAQRVTRESTDPLRRRLLNVVEEMAIASGVPVPEVYVLEQETGINAFAAGLSTADAAVAVTRGALERLNRAELSGVIGHEFSHILNGDMRLNTRLAGPLFGLLIIATAARHLLRNMRGGSGGRKGGAVVLAVLAVMALGYLGVFLGRLLQSAISRQREFLADASSAQFTRDPGALRDALVRIAHSSRGTTLTAADSEDLAHMFFLPAYSRLFATHPPLAERVKALDPRYPLQELDKVEAETLQVAGEETLTSESGVAVAGFAGNGQQVAVAPGQIAGSVGRPGLDHVAYARSLRESLPPELDEALKRGSTAACAWLALLLQRDGPVRDRQLQDIEATFGAAVAQHVQRLEPAARALPLVQRLPLLQRAMPVLRAVPAERRRMLAALTYRLAAADGQVDVFEFALSHLAGQYLAEQIASPARVRPETIDACQDELGVLFSALASHGHDSPVEARRAYERGISHVLPRERPAYSAPASADWTGPLDRALQRLDRLPPMVKEMLVEGLGRTVTHDGLIQVSEAELLRAACAALHCPLPPLLEGSGTPAGNSPG